jgi:hypothetical protein
MFDHLAETTSITKRAASAHALEPRIAASAPPTTQPSNQSPHVTQAEPLFACSPSMMHTWLACMTQFFRLEPQLLLGSY